MYSCSQTATITGVCLQSCKSERSNLPQLQQYGIWSDSTLRSRKGPLLHQSRKITFRFRCLAEFVQIHSHGFEPLRTGKHPGIFRDNTSVNITDALFGAPRNQSKHTIPPVRQKPYLNPKHGCPPTFPIEIRAHTIMIKDDARCNSIEYR